MYEISEISTNLFKMYEYPMYCKMLGVGNSVILKKKNVCKSLVEPRSVILARFSIFSIQLRFIVKYEYMASTVLVLVLAIQRSTALVCTYCSLQLLVYCNICYSVLGTRTAAGIEAFTTTFVL